MLVLKGRPKFLTLTILYAPSLKSFQDLWPLLHFLNSEKQNIFDILFFLGQSCLKGYLKTITLRNKMTVECTNLNENSIYCFDFPNN